MFNRVWAQLQELGWLGPHTVVVVVGDGSEWIWNRARMFTKRFEILDFWHAIEYAWVQVGGIGELHGRSAGRRRTFGDVVNCPEWNAPK